jgi:hypothetical protein
VQAVLTAACVTATTSAPSSPKVGLTGK